MPTKESALIKKCRTWTEKRGGVFHKEHAGNFSQGGWPDVTAVIHGVTYLIEFKKSETEVPSKQQMYTIEQINNAGGCAFICGSFEDFLSKTS